MDTHKRYVCPFCKENISGAELPEHMFKHKEARLISPEIHLSEVGAYLKKMSDDDFFTANNDLRFCSEDPAIRDTAMAIGEKILEKKKFPCCKNLTYLDVELLYSDWVENENMERIAGGEYGHALKDAFDAGLCSCSEADRAKRNTYEGEKGIDPLIRHRRDMKEIDSDDAIEKLLKGISIAYKTKGGPSRGKYNE